MTNAPQKTDVKNVQVAILTYSQESMNFIWELFVSSGLPSVVSIVTGNLANHASLTCDIAVTYFSDSDSIEQYISDVASLRVIKKIPVVIGIFSEGKKSEAVKFQGELATDENVFLPINPYDFAKNVMNYAVSQKIKTKKTKNRSRFASGSKLLGEILIESQIITPLQLKKALDYQKSTDMRLGDTLVLLGFIDEEQKIRFLASQQNLEIATPMQFASADLEVVALIPETVARRYHCIALERDNGTLTVAMLDVLNLQLLDHLRDITDLSIKPVLGKKEDIQASIERYYSDISSHQDASSLMADLGEEDVEYIQKDTEEINLEEAEAAGAELGIVKLVNILFANAVRDRTSDIHIEPQENELAIRYRIDGDLKKVMSPPKKSHQAIITRIKILSNLDIAERRLPQDGRMVVKMGKKEVDVRVSILPSVFGEKAVLRILDKDAFDVNIKNLGFTKKNISIFKENITKPYGMIIVTGPTGSGKSTTLYSAIRSIQSVTKNIITVEDPVEFHISGVTQVHVRSEIGLTFGAALRSILRQDPDVILIGEIRDGETADIAIKMALTGHLVFSTLHTNDAASSIARFVDIGIPPLLLGSSLNLIMAQRLVRRVCPKCKVEYKPELELLEQLHLHKRSDIKFYKGEGCVNCNGSGYRGRIGLYEMLNVSRPIKKLILKNVPTNEIQDLAKKEGMFTLRDAGIEKVIAGETTIEQVIAVTTEI